MKLHRSILALAIAALFAASVPTTALGQQVPSPEAFFGHVMGADRQLARWDRLVEYYELLGEASDRLDVRVVGESTLGNPFLVIFASSPENLANLDELKRMNAVLQDPREHSQAEIDNAIENGKVVFVQSYALHSTEVAASQSAAEIMYDFVTRNDEEILTILDETVSILIPGMNPDGNIIVTDWYNEWVGTEYEGAGPPELYHHYIGHDNNRDAFMQNTVESQYVADIMFREWIPQAYIDHHQMGGYTARMSLPPYAEPIRPDGDPLVWREMAWYGAQMALKMDENNLPGAVGAAIYSGWGHFGFHWITPFHNIAGMLTEAASARLATPLYVHPDQLGGSRQLPEYEEQTTFPSPWEGGWWRVRDIVDRQIVATFSPLEIASKNRKTVLRNAYNKASRQTQRGADGETKAFVIPVDQHDGLTMQLMVNKLIGQGITVERAPSEFTHEGRVYGAGSYVVSMAQPKRGLIRWLLGQTFYPDNTYTRDREGNPIRPYDMTTDNISEFMGVRVDPVGSAVTARLDVVPDYFEPRGTVEGSGPYRMDGRQNASFQAANLLMADGVTVRRADRDAQGVMAGDFVVPTGASSTVLNRVAQETGVTFESVGSAAASVGYALTPQRVGMYQRHYGGNMDEGWTRLLLENWNFDYTSLFDRHILEGDLHEKYDVIILPADSKTMMLGPTGSGGGRGANPAGTPPEYRSGFGQEGVDALEAFVQNGGTLVTFAQAGDLAIDEFDLPVQNAIAGVWGNDFWAPGASLRVTYENDDPYAWGMPRNGLATFLAGGQVYETRSGARSSDVKVLATYPDRDILESGWLLGEQTIANKAAAVSVKHGEGSVLLLGFRVQHRHQTHGTFKLLFNALMERQTRMAEVAAGGGGD